MKQARAGYASKPEQNPALHTIIVDIFGCYPLVMTNIAIENANL